MGSESHASGLGQPWWVHDPGTPYEVSRLKIMEFAQAIGDPNAVYRDPDAARQAGYPDVIAPPTFAVVVALPASIAAVRETVPETGHPVIVHVEQRFEYARPIRAGDVLHAESAVIGIRELRGAAMVTARTEIRAADGEHICSAWAILAKLPSAAANEPQPPRPRAKGVAE